MIEPEIEIEDDEPNPERVEAIQRACQIFTDVCRWSPNGPRDENDMDEIVNTILRQKGDLTDSLQYTLAWRRIREERQEAARQEAAFSAREEAHLQEVEDYKRPRAHDLPAVLAEMKNSTGAAACPHFG